MPLAPLHASSVRAAALLALVAAACASAPRPAVPDSRGRVPRRAMLDRSAGVAEVRGVGLGVGRDVLDGVLAPSGPAAQDAPGPARPQDVPGGQPVADWDRDPDPARPADAEEASGPWRLDEALGAPSWLKLGGAIRGRYEYLSDQFRAGLSGPGDLFVLRTTLRADVRFAPVDATFELLDARALLEIDDSTPINTTIVNPLEVLQAYVGASGDDLRAEGDRGAVLLGRHTMDVGSRRLVARNRFRNTINAFTGLNATYGSAGGAAFRGFFTLPVRRRPTAEDDLSDNEVQIDSESSGTRFWGLYASQRGVLPGLDGELYYYDLDESDEEEFPSRNRRLSTTGLRVWRERAAGALDFEVEAAYQFGTSRATASASDATDLDHRAHFEHAELGYTFRGAWAPRLVAQLDYVSGDRDPNDGENNRFDTLYGARRFDFGPTGIFGAFARANLVTPGLRLFLEPSTKFDVMAASRFYYLASATDAWVGTGIRDPSGESGDYVGNLTELRLRWKALPENLVLDLGGTYFFEGGFPGLATGGNSSGDTSYAYLQATLAF